MTFWNDFFAGGGIGQAQSAMQGGAEGIAKYEAMPWWQNMNNWSQILGKTAGIVAPGGWQEQVGNLAAGIGQSGNMQVANKKSELQRQNLIDIFLGRPLAKGMTPAGKTGGNEIKIGSDGTFTLRGDITDKLEAQPLPASELDVGKYFGTGGGKSKMNMDFLSTGGVEPSPFAAGSTGSSDSMFQLGLSPELILEQAKLKGTLDDSTIKNVLAAAEMSQNQPLKDSIARANLAHAKAYEAQASPEMQNLAILKKLAEIEHTQGLAAKTNLEYMKMRKFLPAEYQRLVAQVGAEQALIRSREVFTAGNILDNRVKQFNLDMGVPELDAWQKAANVNKTWGEIEDLARKRDAGEQGSAIELGNYLNKIAMSIQSEVTSGDNAINPQQKMFLANQYNTLAKGDIIFLAEDVGGDFKVVPKKLGRLSTGQQITPAMIYDAVRRNVPLNVALSRAGVMGNYSLPGR